MAGKFNPAQHPRDKNGRFTKSRTVKASAKDKASAKSVAEAFKPKAVPAGDRKAYLEGIASGKAPLGDVAEANKALRAGKDSPAADIVEQAMVALPDDVLLSRQVPMSAFGKTEPEALAGMKVRDAGFAPAQLGTVLGAPDQVRMHLAVPAGTRAAVNPATGEVVLDRDTEMVVASVASNAAGGHDMYLTVLPKTGAKPSTGSARPAPDGTDIPEGGDQVRGDLMKLKVPELRAQMRERGLKPGKLRKSQMVDALVADETGDESTPDRTAQEPPTQAPDPASPAPKPAPEPAKPRPVEPALAPARPAVSGSAALAAAPTGVYRPDSGLQGDEITALKVYRNDQANYYQQINDMLRGTGPRTGTAKRWVASIDGAMTKSALTDDVTVDRGIRDGRLMFADRMDASLTGMSWREDGFTSTSADRGAVDQFTDGASPVRMRIVAPAGTRAVDLSDPDSPDEAELLLDRGLTMTVVADLGVVGGVRQLEVQVVPAEGDAP